MPVPSSSFFLRLLEVNKLIAHSAPGKLLTTNMIAEHIGTSAKTITRVIRFLRDELNYNPQYIAAEHRWHYVWQTLGAKPADVSEILPTGPLSADISSLFLAQKAMAHLNGTAMEKAFRDICKQVTGSCDERFSLVESKIEEAFSFRDGGVSRVRPEDFETISRCILERIELGFHYTNRGKNSAEPRIVHPYHLTCVDSVWYLLAHDCHRKAMRIFALSRISGIQLSDREFVRPANFSAAEFMKNAFGIFHTQGTPREVRVRFDAWAAISVRERLWHSSQTEVALEDGGIEISLLLSSTTEVERWILGWGNHATVLEPADLAQQICEYARQTLANYGEKPVERD
jgi:predicted DNA-binding transcriptional regulator YafY